MQKKIFFVIVFMICIVSISIAQIEKKPFLITKIDSLGVYYIVTALEINNNKSHELFIVKEKPLPDTISHLTKINVGKCYLFHIERMYTFITSEDKEESIVLPHAPFYVDKKLISTTSYKPFEVINIVDLYIKPEDILDCCTLQE